MNIAHHAAITLVAASNTPDRWKAQADYICDGEDDQVELTESLTEANRFPVNVDASPAQQRTVECFGRHSVVWLPGDYYLDASLIVPDAADCAIHAEGTYFHYRPLNGDAVIVTGMHRCRYRFGTIEAASSGAALCIRPTTAMPALMSIVSFTGLIGNRQRGIGLHLDPGIEGICTNRFEGTDIAGFDVGVYVENARGKCDTNWFWFSYIRLCHTCIWEQGRGVDSAVWQVNVDASLPDAVAIRTAAKYGKWYAIMGTYRYERRNKAVILDPGASHNVIEVHPPIEEFAWEDNSGNDTNVILSTRRPPYRPGGGGGR